MILTPLLLTSLITGTARASAIQKRFTNGDSPTGTTDPNVVKDCSYWANSITSSDTCVNLENYFGITTAQLTFWNPSLSSTNCVLTVGWSYCVESPSVPTTTTTSTTTVPTTTSTSPTTTTTTSTSGAPSPTQSGLISTCDAFYKVQAGDICYNIVTSFGNFTIDQFYQWNPAVKTDCSGLQAGYYVCVGVPGLTTTTTTTSTTIATTTTSATHTGPSPTQTGIISDCVTYYQVQSGDSCWSIVTKKYSYLTTSEFISWNPAVGATCSYLDVGYWYCVATSTVQPMPGTISTCTKYYQVASGDSCWSIEQANSITATQFNTWNPDVGSECAHLWLGYFVCVGAS
ncbi:putative LysM domain protein [Aspergillus clavatus NRRL 1]|uniref:LysM domain protein n=1 Tax=Aspergillus clavatus (strain ATCC 1007 / CBS 513.65 / DSM 816 / NCTC 3887 / NRRL 1 / QM 1276 / 107) TaxID=344612 RepID=A1C6S3_ASPCL|nr:LysM domain protein [Aspergillus clavatus NRRL 1]EAW14094.1 LysM domain protein [Aspergillus clavatus NRRL 1]